MLSIVIEMLKLFFVDALLVCILLAALIPLASYKRAAYAVLKRNFLAYFSNPTGYVFLCLFVLLSSLAAFWPHDFFQSNLANLDQLNLYLPQIMLVFVAAITMSIWAEERRQGTDELLLTIPADDFDIVLGKYLAAVCVFSASLLFSQLTNYAVLNALTLGDLDTGLFVTTYIGYWLIGLAMLAVGMIASFMTSNVTVGFILGVLFNLPLVAAMWANTIIHSVDWSMRLARLSYFVNFESFGRGVISFSSVVYFLLLVAFGIYVCMILVGRRHWRGGRDGESMLIHYAIRIVALFVFTIGLNLFLTNFDKIRVDTSDEKLSSLSRDTRNLINELDLERPIYIEAFLSKSLPEMYVRTKYDMVSMLGELTASGGKNIEVRVHDDLEPFSDDAVRAEQQYGIKAETVLTRSRGAFKQEDIFLGAAFTCGLEKVIVPFFDRGIPVEYEMVRSICTVAQAKRLKIGVIKTDAQLFGSFQFTGMQPRQIPKQLIIAELEKQYEVEEVDPVNPIGGTYDVLLVAQPSSLTQPQLDNVLDAVKRGVPTAIFEDPMPVALNSAPGTSQPKRPAGGGMFGGGQQQMPEPKGNIAQLWELLGITMLGEDNLTGQGRDAYVVWQQHNPYPKTRHFRHFTPQFVFVGPDAPGADDPLNSNHPISSKLQQLLLLYPGAVVKQGGGEELEFQALVTTGSESGYIKYQDVMATDNDPIKQRFLRRPTQKQYILAAHIKSTGEKNEAVEDDGGEEESHNDEEHGDHEHGDHEHGDHEHAEGEHPHGDIENDESKDEGSVNVVYVADIDMLSSAFLQLRARPDEEVEFKFDNVTFVLNIVDFLAGDDRFLDIRKRQTHHSTLKAIEELTEQARQDANTAVDDYDQEFKDAEQEAKDEMEKSLKKFKDEVERIRKQTPLNRKLLEAAIVRQQIKERAEQQKLDTKIKKLERDRDLQLKEIERNLDLQTTKVQNTFKVWAAVLPPIPPLLVGCIVFVYRRLREREGVSKARMK